MRFRPAKIILFSATLAGWVFGVGACTTTETVPNPAPAALPPPYVQVPHPAGYDMADVRAIFYDKGAPPVDSLKDCDADFMKLKTATNAYDEIAEGSRELVRMDPVKYHWCFYGKLVQLENDLRTTGYVDDKQKKILSTYSFLVPISRAYIHEFHDSRYMRWAIRHYRRVSEWMFYRKLELSPKETSELVEASNPFGVLREPDLPKPVLEKYNIVAAPPVAPAAAASPAPAPSLVPVAEASPAPLPPAPAPVASVEAVPPPPVDASNGILPAPVAPQAVAAPSPAPVIEQPPQAAAQPPQAPPPAEEPAARQPAAQPQQRKSAVPGVPTSSNQPENTDSSVEAILQGDTVVPTN